MLNIGIDIAKRSHTAGAVDGDGKVAIGSFQFNNTADGFAKLLARLAKAGAEPEDALIGMEATGHYWIALFDFLCSHGWKAAVINPIQTDAFRKVETVRKLKTDASDALLIADLVRFKAFEPSAMADEATAGIRDLARFRMSLVEECTALKNQLRALMDDKVNIKIDDRATVSPSVALLHNRQSRYRAFAIFDYSSLLLSAGRSLSLYDLPVIFISVQ